MGGWAVVPNATNAPPNPWAVVSHAPVGAEVQAQRDADAHGKDTPASDQGFFHSFYEMGVKPIVDQLKDARSRGDLGAHAADEILRSFMAQVGNYAANPDIRNLPVIGTGATATGQRMQEQVDKGNYLGAAGSAAGFVAPFAAAGSAGAVKDAAVATKEAITANAAKNAKLVDLGVTLAKKAAMRGTGTSDVIGVLGKFAKAAGEDVKAPPAPTPGASALERMRASNAAAEEANASRVIPEEPEPAPPAPAPPQVLAPQGGAFNTAYGQPSDSFVQPAPVAEPAPAPAPRGGVRLHDPADVPDYEEELLDAKARAATSAKVMPHGEAAQAFGGIEFAPGANPWAVVSHEPAAPAVETAPPAQAPAPAASVPEAAAEAPSELERQLQASLTRSADPSLNLSRDKVGSPATPLVERHPRADANRVAAADRIARDVTKLDIELPPGDGPEHDAAWGALAQNLGERKGYVPSADTRQLIRERVDAAATKAADAPLRKRLAAALAPVKSVGDLGKLKP